MNNLLFDPTKLRILLVDDTPANLDILRKVLIAQGYNIAFAQSGEKALNLAKRLKPDLILLDVMMPGMDGFETCKRLKSNKATQAIPVIFITAKIEHEDILKGFEYGGVDYIAKPFHQKEVLIRVKTYLQLQVSNRQLALLNEEKNAILRTSAYDLKEPLSSLIGALAMLYDDMERMNPTEIKTYLKKMMATSHGMLQKLEQLCDTSEIDRACLGYAFCLTHLEDIIEMALLNQMALMRQKQINLSTEFEDTPKILIDPYRISQVVVSLLNALIEQCQAQAKLGIVLTLKDKKTVELVIKLQGKIAMQALDKEIEISAKVINTHHGQLLLEQSASDVLVLRIQLPIA